MLTKILLTTLVLLAALTFIRHQNSRNRREALQREAEQQAQRRTAMLVAGALVALTLLVSGGIYYWHWQQAHRILEVQVTNSHSGVQQHYRVYASELDGRRFRTTDGRTIILSDAERLEVHEPPQ